MTQDANTAAHPHARHDPHERLDELDGLRGLLALWVAVSHVFNWCGFWEVTPPPPFTPLWIEFKNASGAVRTFMILSGFAISLLLSKRTLGYREYMIGRFFRIYPVYFVCLLLGLGSSTLIPEVLHTALWQRTIYFQWVGRFAASEASAKLAHTLSHLTLLHGAVPKQLLVDSTATLLTPAWSISLEWQYYLVAPLLALLARSGAGLLVVTLCTWLGIHYAESWQNPHLGFLPAHLPLFMVGIGSYHVYARVLSSSDPQLRARMSVPVAALLGMSILSSWNSLALGIWAIGFGCVLVRGDDPFARVLGGLRQLLLHRWLQALGKLGYPLYLVHWPIVIGGLSLLLRWKPAIMPPEAVMLLLGFGMPVILLAAQLLHVYVERPLQSYGKQLGRRLAR